MGSLEIYDWVKNTSNYWQTKRVCFYKDWFNASPNCCRVCKILWNPSLRQLFLRVDSLLHKKRKVWLSHCVDGKLKTLLALRFDGDNYKLHKNKLAWLCQKDPWSSTIAKIRGDLKHDNLTTSKKRDKTGWWLQLKSRWLSRAKVNYNPKFKQLFYQLSLQETRSSRSHLLRKSWGLVYRQTRNAFRFS